MFRFGSITIPSSVFAGLMVSLLLFNLREARADLVVANFEEFTFASGQQFFNGKGNPGPFQSRGATFNNSFSTSEFGGVTYESWYGFSYSKVQNSTQPGFENQYAAFPGRGTGGSDNYLIAYADGFSGRPSGGAYFNLPGGSSIVSVDVANTTYTALYIRDGLQPPFNPTSPYGAGDYFDVVFTGYTSEGAVGSVTGQSTFRLADYTSGTGTVLNSWATVNLSGLGSARSIGISFNTTDVDPVLGINTPTYLALDNVTFQVQAVPEPSSFALLALASASVLVRRRRKGR